MQRLARCLDFDRLFPRFADGFVLTAILSLVVACCAASLLSRAAVDLAAYGMHALLIFGIGGAGLTCRLSGRSEGIASALVAMGLLLSFTLVLSTYNHLILPVATPLADPALFSFSALLGYDWTRWVAWGARHPDASWALALAYTSSLPQLTILVVALGLTNRLGELDRLMTTLVLGAMATVFVWSLFPSISVSAFQTVAPETERAASIVVDAAEGARLLHFVNHGIERITPLTMTGLIGFPSFHTILALLCARFAWRLPFARWVFVALNTAMLPAILLHGSHHVADVAGGAVIFCLALWGTERLLGLSDAGARDRTAARRPA